MKKIEILEGLRRADKEHDAESAKCFCTRSYQGAHRSVEALKIGLAEALNEMGNRFRGLCFKGHVSFSKHVAESPLGPIKVQIRCDNPPELI